MLCAWFISNSVETFAQQKDTLLQRIKFNVEFADYYVTRLTSNERLVRLPSEIYGLRAGTYNNYNPGRALDNPLYHSAFYIDLYGTVAINDSIDLTVNLLSEHRGISYGVYNSADIAIVPQFNLKGKQHIKLFNKDLTLFGDVGNRRNISLYEGLVLYNLDVQGIDMSLSYRRLHFRLHHIGDLQRGIGLNIDDALDYMLSLESLPVEDKWLADLRLGYYHEYGGRNYEGLKASIGVQYNDNTRVYGQTALTTGWNYESGAGMNNMAFLIGAKHQGQSGRFSWQFKTEGRYFGANFNTGLKNTTVTYRQSRESGVKGHTIGNTLYPIYYYERPFSQWAVFTEYQSGTAMSGISVLSDLSFLLGKGIYLDANLDLNHIRVDGEQPFTYPFYTGGISWKMSDKSKVMLLVTNKGMNLDVHYPTFYLFRDLNYGFMLKRSL